MHISKIGAVAIALAELAGTSANALTTTQTVSYHAISYGYGDSEFDQQYSYFQFDTFDVPGQILTSVHLEARLKNDFNYHGIVDFYCCGFNPGLDTFLDSSFEDTFGLGSFDLDDYWGDSRSINWIPRPSGDYESAAAIGSFSHSTTLRWDNYDNLDLYQNSYPLLMNFSQNSGLFFDQNQRPDYFSSENHLNADFTVTYVSRAAVPEPASWALMISGFGLIGTALRQRRQRRIA